MKKIFSISIAVLFTIFLFVIIQKTHADEFYPGKIEDTGTHFEITDSDYLNITIESTEEIHLILASIPEMVMMEIESTASAISTIISLSGFQPLTTYYKYEDNYHNLEVFTMDENGEYSYTQDISTQHLLFIQPRQSTKFIPSDTSIGTWDPETRTYTLIMDVNETIQIDEDNLTLDGTGYTMTGSGTGHGIYLESRTGITISNVNIEGFTFGVFLKSSNNNNLTDNIISNNGSGITLFSNSNSNTLTRNTVNSNNDFGITLFHYTSNNELTENIVNSNFFDGILFFYYSYNNTLTRNSVNSNNRYGINISWYSENNLIYNNYFSNTNNAIDSWGNNIWNIDKTEGVNIIGGPFLGGNYWSDYTGTDTDGDGLGDTSIPYDAGGNIYNGGDYFPLVSFVSNVPPIIVSITAPIDPIQVETEIGVSAIFTDPDDDIHTAIWDWGDDTTSAGIVIDRTVTGCHVYINPGIYTISLTVTDGNELDTDEYKYVVVYNPDGDFVTGGGWINSPEGAYKPDPSLTGKANFGFVSKYTKGKSITTGETEFNFKVADMNFHSDSYDWLAVAGPKAMYKGTGTINGTGNYGFMLTAIDAALTPSTDVDLFRIKIWDKDNSDEIIYDNQMNAPDDADPTTEIGGGSIVIHNK